jgi:hypothetical protein
MRIKGVSMEMTSDREELKKQTCCVDSTKLNTVMMKMS